MQALEETFNPHLVGLFLLLMTAVCLTTFSVSMASLLLAKVLRKNEQYTPHNL
jgi:hypothetical protein